MYDADNELNDLHEFMREEAEAREKQDNHYDTEAMDIAKNMHKEDY